MGYRGLLLFAYEHLHCTGGFQALAGIELNDCVEK